MRQQTTRKLVYVDIATGPFTWRKAKFYTFGDRTNEQAREEAAKRYKVPLHQVSEQVIEESLPL